MGNTLVNTLGIEKIKAAVFHRVRVRFVGHNDLTELIELSGKGMGVSQN